MNYEKGTFAKCGDSDPHILSPVSFLLDHMHALVEVEKYLNYGFVFYNCDRMHTSLYVCSVRAETLKMCYFWRFHPSGIHGTCLSSPALQTY